MGGKILFGYSTGDYGAIHLLTPPALDLVNYECLPAQCCLHQQGLVCDPSQMGEFYNKGSFRSQFKEMWGWPSISKEKRIALSKKSDSIALGRPFVLASHAYYGDVFSCK